MMKFSSRLLSALLIGVGLLPVAGQAMDQPRCSIASIRMGKLTAGFPMSEPQFVEGWVEVTCSVTGPDPQTLEFGLMELGNELPPTAVDASRKAHIRVDLFADGAGHLALPINASALVQYPTRQLIPASGTAQLSIPLYARVVSEKLLEASEHSFTRNIALLYRVSASR